MPLKEPDLKTVDAYKKAMRLDVPKLTTGTKFWIYRDVEIPNASGKKEKIASFIALVDQKEIKPLLRGKTLVCKGTVGLQDGKVSFEPESGKVPYRTLKKSVPFFLGKMVHIPTDADEDDDGGESGTSETESEEKPTKTTQTTQTPQSSGPGLAPAWNKLFEEVKAAVSTHPERKDELSRASAGISDLIKENKTEEATKRMETLRNLLKAPPSTTQPQPSTGGGLAATWNKLLKDVQNEAVAHPERKDALARAATGIPDLIKENKLDEAKKKMDYLQSMLDKPPSNTELVGRWNTLLKQMQTEATAHPEKKPDLVRAAAGIPDMIKAGKLDLAKKLMDGVDLVLAAKPEPKTEEPQAKTSQPEPVREEESESEESEISEDDAKSEFEDRFADLDDLAQDALKVGAGDISQIRSVLAFAREKGQKGDYKAAIKSLDKLQDLIDEADDAARKPKIAFEGLVKYRQALLGFDTAKTQVDGQILRLKQEIPKLFPGEAEISELIAERLMELNEAVSDAVDDAMNTAESDATPITAEVRKSLDKYLDEIDNNELIKRVDSNPIAPLTIAATLRAALLKIQQNIPVTA